MTTGRRNNLVLRAVTRLGMHSRCEFEFHFYAPFGGKLIWLTFFGLQETEVPAIIGSPFVVCE